MTQLDSTTARAVQDYWDIIGEFPYPVSQFCVSPWCHTGVAMEWVEGKIFFIFLLLVLIFTLPADYCVTCMQCVFIIDPCEKAVIYKVWRTGLKSTSVICFMTFARTARAPNGSQMRSSKSWGPIKTRLHLRRSKWRPRRAEDQPAVALYTLEAPPPSRAHGWDY